MHQQRSWQLQWWAASECLFWHLVTEERVRHMAADLSQPLAPAPAPAPPQGRQEALTDKLSPASALLLETKLRREVVTALEQHQVPGRLTQHDLHAMNTRCICYMKAGSSLSCLGR